MEQNNNFDVNNEYINNDFNFQNNDRPVINPMVDFDNTNNESVVNPVINFDNVDVQNPIDFENEDNVIKPINFNDEDNVIKPINFNDEIAKEDSLPIVNKEIDDEKTEINFKDLNKAVKLLDEFAAKSNITVDKVITTVKLFDDYAEDLGTNSLALFETILKLGSEESFKKLIENIKD